MFDFGSSAFNIGLQAIQDQRARSWEEKQTDKKYNRDIEQRDYQNWYNSPENQMKRFTDAGLNPNLIYGQGTPGNQPSSVSATKAAGRFTPPQMSSINAMDMLGKFAAIKKTVNETDLVSENVNFQKMQNAIMKGTMQSQIDLRMAQLQNMLARTKNEGEKNNIYQQIQALNQQKLAIETQRAEWMKQGFTTNDSSILRIGYQQLQKFGGKITGPIKLNNR